MTFNELSFYIFCQCFQMTMTWIGVPFLLWSWRYSWTERSSGNNSLFLPKLLFTLAVIPSCVISFQPPWVKNRVSVAAWPVFAEFALLVGSVILTIGKHGPGKTILRVGQYVLLIGGSAFIVAALLNLDNVSEVLHWNN